jgi:HEAT repeat protein
VVRFWIAEGVATPTKESLMDDHVGRLLTELGSGDGVTRTRARETLVLIGEPAVANLEALLKDDDKQVRWEAAKALGAVRDPRSVDTFVRLLDDQSSELRWLAASGLIDLGPRSVRAVLQSLNDPEVPRGHLEMSHRILGELARGNDVLAGLVKPVLDVLGRNDRGVIATTAARALSDFDRITGRPPEPATAGLGSDEDEAAAPGDGGTGSLD